MATVSSALPLQSALAAPRTGALATTLLWTNVAGLLGVCCFYRVWELNHVPGINGDEAWYGIQAMKLLGGEPFAWRTPTNNLLNALYFLPLVALHAVWSPSAALLRMPAVLSGLLALPVNYALCRKAFDAQTAMVSTVLLAVLPVNIAYSRFGWDASQTLLATLLVTYLPLVALRQEATRPRWLIAAAVVFAAALVVHPTNIFTAPLVAAPLVWLSRHELLQQARRLNLQVGVALLAAVGGVGWLARHWVAAVGRRLLEPWQLVEFAWNYERLLSGVTVYRYIAGSLGEGGNSMISGFDLLPIDLAVVLLLCLCAAALWPLVRRDATGLDRSLLAGWALCLAGFFLVAGPGAIAPHYERYGLCLIAPSTLLAARCASWWRSQPGRLGASVAVFGWLMAWLTAAGFQQHYFAFFHRTGGESHATFRTAATEPKQAALEQILRARRGAAALWIITSEYWNDQPLRYLSAAADDVRIARWEEVHESADFQSALQEGRAWFVEFTGSRPQQAARERLAERRIEFIETEILDYSGRPVLSVIGVQNTKCGVRSVE